ncbi:hypothetical protein K6T12_15570 [Marinobacterium sp. CAU 1594]|nr:hypothetical protein [Marinobacterium arenosum]
MMLALLLTACASQPDKPFHFKNLAKSDIDMVADRHHQAISGLTRQLAIKLYKRNPRELAKANGVTLERRLKLLFPINRASRKHAELAKRDSVAAVQLAFDPEFNGDRVFALMVGVTGMLNAAYNGQREFFLTDELDQQKLYHSARNLEVIAWQLRNKRGEDGKLLILSNGSTPEGIENLSYERLFGKMIALQDMLAQVVADKSSRAINRVVHSAASMTLLPI